MRRLRWLMLLLLLSGCAKVTLVHDSLGAADLDQAKWACNRDLGVLGAGAGANSNAQLAYVLTSYRADLEQCLALKGWHRATTP